FDSQKCARAAMWHYFDRLQKVESQLWQSGKVMAWHLLEKMPFERRGFILRSGVVREFLDVISESLSYPTIRPNVLGAYNSLRGGVELASLLTSDAGPNEWAAIGYHARPSIIENFPWLVCLWTGVENNASGWNEQSELKYL